MYLSFEQLLIFMLFITTLIYITALLVFILCSKAFGFLTPSGFDNYLTNNLQIKGNYKSGGSNSGVTEVTEVPDEYSQMPDELPDELESAGDIYSSDLEYYLAKKRRVAELQDELEQLKSTTTLKDFINVPEKVEPLTIYDIPEDEVNSSDLYDEDVEIITPEYEKFMEEKMRR